MSTLKFYRMHLIYTNKPRTYTNNWLVIRLGLTEIHCVLYDTVIFIETYGLLAAKQGAASSQVDGIRKEER